MLQLGNKFTKKDWAILKNNIQGFRGELHHTAGKQYEYLNLLLPLSVHEHRGNGHAKNYHQPDLVPKELRDRALSLWKTWLPEEDFNYFVENGLIYDYQV